MTIDNQPEIVEINGWVFRIQSPPQRTSPAQVMLLLHGHLGNENAMWILANPLPQKYHFLAPRAPKKMGNEQYSWHAISPQWPEINTYRDMAVELIKSVDQWLKQQGLSDIKLDLLGFSQGAVMAYALAILFPERIGRVAAIAGFIPKDWQTQLDHNLFADQVFFVSHGNQDEIIPIKKARQTAQWIEQHGGQVTFCDAEIGHKISANCFNGLGEFFS